MQRYRWRMGESGWKLHKVNLLGAEGILNLTKTAQAVSESSKTCLKPDRPRRMWDNTRLPPLAGGRPGGAEGEGTFPSVRSPRCGPWAQPAMPLGFSTHTAAAQQREASPRDQATRRWTSASPQPGEAAIGPGSPILSPPARPRRRSAAPPHRPPPPPPPA